MMKPNMRKPFSLIFFSSLSSFRETNITYSSQTSLQSKIKSKSLHMNSNLIPPFLETQKIIVYKNLYRVAIQIKYSLI